MTQKSQPMAMPRDSLRMLMPNLKCSCILKVERYVQCSARDLHAGHGLEPVEGEALELIMPVGKGLRSRAARVAVLPCLSSMAASQPANGPNVMWTLRGDHLTRPDYYYWDLFLRVVNLVPPRKCGTDFRALAIPILPYGTLGLDL